MVTAITSIALDHQQYLGTSIAEIAREKAGIIKHGVPLVIGPLVPDAERVIGDVAREQEAPLIRAYERGTVDPLPPPSGGGQAIHLRTPRRDYGAVTLGLEGGHQVDNAVVAVRVLECLDESGLAVPQDAIVEGLARVRWPGRLEQLQLAGGRSVLLDAAHNPAGADALAAFLSQRERRQPLVFASMRDKDARGILAALMPHVSSVVFTRATTARSADPHALLEIAAAIAPDVAGYIEDSVHDALCCAWKLSPDIVVAGSIFLLGDVLQELERT
jgi:dihydrofolate synthase/folylpolyglutamate synthase